MSYPEKEVVREGYDSVASAYLEARTRDGADVALLETLLGRLPAGSLVMDAGCGSGVPVSGRLIEAGHQVVGLDFSFGQLSLARAVLPASRVVQGELTALRRRTVRRRCLVLRNHPCPKSRARTSAERDPSGSQPQGIGAPVSRLG